MIMLAGMHRVSTAAAIAAELREAIHMGRYGPGVQLPSATVLQARYGVARGTVTAAIGLLKREGLVTGRPGAGWFVAEPAEVEDVYRTRLTKDKLRGPHIVERVTARPATVADAERLSTPVGSPLLEIRRVIVQPDGTQTSSAPVALTTGYALVYELDMEG